MRAPLKPPRRSDGEATRTQVLATALALFRKRGYQQTTMRDIAGAAGLSVGAAYHYFPSKEDLVLAWFDQIQERSQAASRAALDGATTTSERVRALVHARLEAFRRERTLMTAIWRGVGDPTSPVSIFGSRTAALRAASVAEFARAIEGEPLPPDVREVLPTVLWAVHMALLLYFVHDRSKGQEQTRALADSSVELILVLARVAGMPGLEAMRAQVVSVARKAGLVIDVGPGC